MNTLDKKIGEFLGKPAILTQEGEEVCDLRTGICYIKSKDGLIERTLIEKKLVVEDGRELLREETPISHSKKSFLI